MSKIKSLKSYKDSHDAIPTKMEGIYLKNVNFSEVGKIQNLAEEAIIEYVFMNLVCDENGEKFDDLNSMDDVEMLPIGYVADVMREVSVCLGELVQTNPPPQI